LPASTPQMNDIAAVHVETTLPLYFDPYSQDRIMGSFILIDPMTNATVAAGMIEGKVEGAYAARAPQGHTRLEARMSRNGHPPAALWIVDRPALAANIEREVFERGWQVQIVSNAEFPAAGLNPVITMLQRLGLVAIFSVNADDPDLRQAIAAVYGEEAFFPADRLLAANTEACAQVMQWLDARQVSFIAKGKRR
jgi:hypothetical protein